MEDTRSPRDAAKVIAAIDLGANAIRMVVAQVFSEGRIEVLDRFQQPVRLGQDTFRRGRLGASAMRAAVGILRDYRRAMDLFQVERVRAVATSAVREASNADNFLNRIYMATRLEVEVIATSEESRLTVSAVRSAVGNALGINQGHTLVVDVGGGSTLLTLLDNGEIAHATSLRLGSIRLQETLGTSDEPPERSAELLRTQIATVIGASAGSLPLDDIRSFVAVGGDARFASREIGTPTESADLVLVDRAELDKLICRCERYHAEELARRFGLPFAEAETLVPALLVYQHLLHVTGATKMIVSRVSMRDGLLLELAREVTGQEDQAVVQGVIHAALAIAEKYHVNLAHAEHVAELAVRLFDFLQPDHGLGSRYRLLLRVAALLHEVGTFVSNQAHHKHSYYLLAHSEIFGLDREEIELVAHVARYHRRSPPKPSHLEYMSQPREIRMAINKLAAILRVADALVRGPGRQWEHLRFEHAGDDLVIYVPDLSEFMLEQRSLAAKGGMFEEVYGMRPRLEEG